MRGFAFSENAREGSGGGAGCPLAAGVLFTVTANNSGSGNYASPAWADGYDPSVFSHNWEPATAKIVARKFKESGDRSGVWEYVADVMSASGEAFRTKLSQPPFMSHVVWLQDGEVVNVLADVRAQRAKFDRSDPRVSGKAKPGSKDSFDEALRQPPGSPPPDQG